MEKIIRWNEEKNKILKSERGIGFETIFSLIEDNKIFDIRDNLNYPNQKYYFFIINDYIYCVPFVETKDEFFLKTIFPSRKYTKNLKELNNETKNKP